MPDKSHVFSRHGTPVVERPSAAFSHLDPIYKWEFTRRHPYYVKNWKTANEYWASQVDQSEFESLDLMEKHRLVASNILMQLIGANASHFPDPANDARLDPEFEPPFKAVLVTDMRHRDWFLNALLMLPEHVRRAVAFVYLEEVARETVFIEGRDLMRAVAKTLSKKPPDELELALMELKGGNVFQDRLIDGLCRLDVPELNKQFPGMLQVNYNAPLEDLVEQFKDVVGKWKDTMNVTETRRRSDKWDDYLSVWDLLEGWHDGHYDGSSEKSLRQIAKELGIRMSTVQAHHRAAFRLITGHDYDPELWTALFGTVKLGSLASKRASWRKGKTRTTSCSPAESVGSRDFSHNGVNFGEGFRDVATTFEDWELSDMVSDLKTLIEKGSSNQEIVAELELEVDAQAVAYFRARHEDGLI